MCAQTTTISPLSLHDALPIFRHYERLLARLEERVIQGEGQRAQERGRREDLHELPGLAAEREANAPPRGAAHAIAPGARSEEHTSELQSLRHLVCRLLLEKKK